MADRPSPWELGGLTVRQLARRVWNEMSADEVLDRAAALSYYFVFALFPALLFVVALLGFLPLGDLLDTLLGYARRVLPGDSASLLERTLREITAQQSGGLLSVGALVAVWSASAGLASVMAAINIAYDVQDARPWWKRRLLALGLTVGFAVFLVVALALMAFGPRIGGAIAAFAGLGGVFTTLWNVISVPIAVGVILLGFALVYYLAPAAEQHWRWVTPGSAAAVALWLVASFGLRLYVTHFGNYSATYGSIGGVILLLLWLYLTGLVLLVGAEVNAVIEHAAAARGAVTAKAEGERAPSPGRAPARRPAAAAGRREPAAAAVADRSASDAEMAGAAIARGIGTLREQGRLPLASLITGLAMGLLVKSHRPRDFARLSGQTLHTSRSLAGAIAAWERYRQRRDGARRAQDARRAA
jgi:membrane protein